MRQKFISKNLIFLCFIFLLSLAADLFSNEVDYSVTLNRVGINASKLGLEGNAANLLTSNLKYGYLTSQEVSEASQDNNFKINLQSASKAIEYFGAYPKTMIGIDGLGKGYFQEDVFKVLSSLGDNGDLLSSRKIHLNYFTSVEKVRAKLWADGSYGEEIDFCGPKNCKSRASLEWTAGATVDLAGLILTGYYSDRDKISFNSFSKGSGLLRSDIFGTYRPREGYRLTGSYDLSAVTRLGFSYGSGELFESTESAGKMMRNNFERSLWAVGVYHDVTSWLRIVAEYNRTKVDLEKNSGNGTDSISVGGVLSW